MAAAHDFDLVVIGGGCAGLSLARILARHDADLRTLVIEPRSDYVDDRTWCFWQRGEHRYRHLVDRTWNLWRFSTPGDRCIQGSDGVSYQRLRSIDFYEDAIAGIRASAKVNLACSTSVLSVDDSGPSVTVTTSSGDVRARYVVDTRPPDLSETCADTMQQVFLGAEVVTDVDLFDPGVAGLMDRMTSDALGFRFTYLLPFSPRNALVEETRFTNRLVSQDDLQTGLDETLDELGVPFDVVRSESGRLPMASFAPAGNGNVRLVKAGIAGGAIRASTGYAFQRIQRWAGDCAAAMAAGGPPQSHAPEPAWRAAVDRLFLRVLQSQPDIGPALFMAMGKSLNAKTLVRFLSDDCRPADFARVAQALPKAPFLRRLIALPG